MIQLATDPTASRTSYAPGQGEDEDKAHETRRGRVGHPWPFLSRHATRPEREESPAAKAAADRGASPE
jgi:hypothetical protein